MSIHINSPLAVIMTAVMALSLSACGGGADSEAPPATQTSTTGITTPATSATVVSTAVAVSANSPAPDCAPENCSSLRIIDGNAEAWRADAAKREARADAGFAG